MCETKPERRMQRKNSHVIMRYNYRIRERFPAVDLRGIEEATTSADTARYHDFTYCSCYLEHSILQSACGLLSLTSFRP